MYYDYQNTGQRNLTPAERRIYFETRTLKATSSTIGLGVIIIILLMQITSAVLFLLLSLFGYQNPTAYADSFSGYNPNLYYLAVAFVSIFSMTISIGFMLKYINKSLYRFLLPLKKVDIKLGLALFSFGFLACITANITTSSISAFFNIFGFHISAPETPYRNTLFVIIFLIITNCLLPAIFEELIFRGIILSSLRRFGDLFAILISSLLFSLVHCNLMQIPFALIVGITFGFIAVKTNSLVIPMLIHFSNNLMSCIILIVSKELGDITSEIVYLIIILIASFVGAVGIKYLVTNEQKFFKLNEETVTVLPFLQRLKTLFTSPPIIIDLVLILITTIINSISS